MIARQGIDDTSYKIIAPYYDWIMTHVDYDVWTEYLRSLWKKHHIRPKTVLELGAGTCNFMMAGLYSSSMRVIFTDLSWYMLLQAKGKAEVRCAAVNALSLPFTGTFDVCLMLYDSINYLRSADDLEQCLKEVHRVLAENGVFIFDVTTEFNSRTFFGDSLECEEREDCAVIRHSWYDRKAKLQGNDFLYFIQDTDSRYVRFEESHRQRVYSIAEIKAVIRRTEFKLLGYYENFGFKTADNRSERIHYVLQK
ncbi:class I SAM-dependent DNA methyltransferase [Fibrobacterota bacterium]